MLKVRVGWATLLFLALAFPLFSAAKEVRVTAQRALVYAEPDRKSARLEIVERGDVLTLFQQTKVKQVWYYVTFSSPRYGSRISGFIHESAVELVTDEAAAASKMEPEKPQPKAAEVVKPPVEQPPPQPVKAKEEKKEPEKAQPKAAEVVKPPVEQPPSQPVKAKEEKKEPEKPQPKAAEVVKPPVEQPPPQPIKAKEEKKEPPPPKPEAKAVKKEKEEPVVAEPPPPPAQPAPPRRAPMTPPRRERGLLTLGLGYGSSFGGAGGMLQLNTKTGFALHAGGGLFPTKLIYSETDWVENEALYSVGIKYYFPIRSSAIAPYIDVQYGGLRVEAAQIVIDIWEFFYVYSQEQKTLWGPSVLAGAELRLGRIGLDGALGISYSLTDWEFLEKRLFLAFDVGLVFYF